MQCGLCPYSIPKISFQIGSIVFVTMNKVTGKMIKYRVRQKYTDIS